MSLFSVTPIQPKDEDVHCDIAPPSSLLMGGRQAGGLPWYWTCLDFYSVSFPSCCFFCYRRGLLIHKAELTPGPRGLGGAPQTFTNPQTVPCVEDCQRSQARPSYSCSILRLVEGQDRSHAMPQATSC
ncbi:hypothetical protein GDO81_019588 [Engystomops pustulosus]|uniref:Uncharacterized protein n=1 Tax=Engystomops pustulosus TaxID=76066 RepID=A0AAV6Z9P4_ENGPU|nr:hypothetical protein GDO81_019588 [Engystomops pustulosus]